MLPVVKGIKRTKLQMIPYTLLLIPAGILLFAYGYVGYIFLVVSVVFGAVWLIQTVQGLKAEDTEKWARTNFLLSVNYLMVIFLAMIIDTDGIF
ncbi:hypothetical protein PACILC2_56280 [Paenibacillus cisolokensis]|uniref:heme o synthase n=1 Tax=Paenibacillus cisolokensis TaxID=1658519 RepID=A0ABQ4NFR8_9BACL|nr:hypothetical protein PACILC2_56280 [Paenibacillus cisolokensis]